MAGVKTFVIFLLWSLALAPRICSANPRLAPVRFELIDNRIFVDVFINSQGPFKFIFDTGGNSSMTFQLASQLGLPVQDAGDGTGAGDGSQPMGETKVRSFQVGDIVQLDQDFLVTDYSKIQTAFNFKKLDGIFGYEILREFLTSIDYEHSLLSFFTSATDFDKSGFESLRFELLYEKPFIKTSINGLTANTLIDTGDRSALTVTKAFRENEAIACPFNAKPTVVSGYGIGGPIPAQVSTLSSLVVGNSLRLENVSARAPTGDGGFNSISGLDASIGNEVLKQFDVGFDYRDQVLYLRKNRNFGKPTHFTPVPNPVSPLSD